jgi:hypothetical protein
LSGGDHSWLKGRNTREKRLVTGVVVVVVVVIIVVTAV